MQPLEQVNTTDVSQSQMTADGIFTKSPTDMEHGKSQCACDPPMMDESHVLTFLFTSYRVQLE